MEIGARSYELWTGIYIVESKLAIHKLFKVKSKQQQTKNKKEKIEAKTKRNKKVIVVVQRTIFTECSCIARTYEWIVYEVLSQQTLIEYRLNKGNYTI